MKNALALVAAAAVVGAQSYTTVYTTDCDDLQPTPAPMYSVTNTVTETYCPECEGTGMGGGSPGGGSPGGGSPGSYTTVYTTVWQALCPTGLAPSTYTITETCYGPTPTWSTGPGHVPAGYTTTVFECDVCQEGPTVTLTVPVGAAPTPTGAASPPGQAAPPPAQPAPPAGGSSPPAGTPAAAPPTCPGGVNCPAPAPAAPPAVAGCPGGANCPGPAAAPSTPAGGSSSCPGGVNCPAGNGGSGSGSGSGMNGTATATVGVCPGGANCPKAPTTTGMTPFGGAGSYTSANLAAAFGAVLITVAAFTL